MIRANDAARATEEIMVSAGKESGLWREHESDPTLRTFYMRRLLKRGWGGSRDSMEQRYCALVHRAEGKYQHCADSLARKRFSPKDMDAPEGVRAQTRLLTRPGRKAVV